jgi:hypothetical protein
MPRKQKAPIVLLKMLASAAQQNGAPKLTQHPQAPLFEGGIRFLNCFDGQDERDRRSLLTLPGCPEAPCAGSRP